MAKDAIEVVAAAGGALTPEQAAQVDAIFFEASGRTFEPGPERDAFRKRWLGRYLQGGTDIVLLAIAADGTVAGYLVGALEDPATQNRFADIGYFRSDFREACRRFPAHLHINLAPAFRSQGIGARLIEAFAGRALEAGVPGMHVVTGKVMRNVRFYTRCGFAEYATTIWNGREVVFLGRALTPA